MARPAHEVAGLDAWAERRSNWPHRLAVVASAATLLLIFVGGLVTNTGSALAVPDWPTTFGYNMFLYPWSKMVGGVFYEHSHRLLGSTVGLLTVALSVALWATERRRWVRSLGVVAVLGVIVQGVLGGLRVVLLQHPLAIIHGCVAQAFFALLVSLAVVTSATWVSAPQAGLADGARLRVLALLTLGLVYVQIVFGALLTHTGSRLDAHLVGALLVTVSVSLLAARVLREQPPRLRRPAAVLVLLLCLQLALGLGAFLWRFTTMNEVMSPAFGLMLQTTHRVTGTAVLGTAVVLTLRIVRFTGVAHRSRTAMADGRSLSEHAHAETGREVLA